MPTHKQIYTTKRHKKKQDDQHVRFLFKPYFVSFYIITSFNTLTQTSVFSARFFPVSTMINEGWLVWPLVMEVLQGEAEPSSNQAFPWWGCHHGNRLHPPKLKISSPLKFRMVKDAWNTCYFPCGMGWLFFQGPQLFPGDGVANSHEFKKRKEIHLYNLIYKCLEEKTLWMNLRPESFRYSMVYILRRFPYENCWIWKGKLPAYSLSISVKHVVLSNSHLPGGLNFDFDASDPPRKLSRGKSTNYN